MELIFSCTDTLSQPATPACTTDYGERITHILLSKTLVTASGTLPTATEFGTAYNNGTLMFLRVASGHKVFLSETEIEVVVKENYDKKFRVEGKIPILNETISRACERLDRYDHLYMYYFTDKDYCFGGYYATPDFNIIEFDGAGKPIYIRFKLDFYPGIDYANKDSSYPQFISGYQILTAEDGDWLTTESGVTIIL